MTRVIPDLAQSLVLEGACHLHLHADAARTGSLAHPVLIEAQLLDIAFLHEFAHIRRRVIEQMRAQARRIGRQRHDCQMRPADIGQAQGIVTRIADLGVVMHQRQNVTHATNRRTC